MNFHFIKNQSAFLHITLILSITIIFNPCCCGQPQDNNTDNYNLQIQQQNNNNNNQNNNDQFIQQSNNIMLIPQQQYQQGQPYIGQVFDLLENQQKNQNQQNDNNNINNNSNNNDIGVINRTTINGAQCLLPFVYRGQVWEDCFIVEGKQMCVVEDHGLQECAPVKKIEKVEKFKEIIRMTMTGEKCEFPFEFGYQLHYDCVDVVGNEMCVTNGTLQECKPRSLRVQRTTTDGRTCLFPFTLLGNQHHDCTLINGVEACMVDGGLSECAPPSPPTPFPRQTVTTRSTVDGRQCQFPYFFMDTEYYDCTQFMGEEWCLLDTLWAKCMHQPSGIRKSSDTSQIIPQTSVADQDFSSATEAISSMQDLATLLQTFYLTQLIPLISDRNLQVTIFAPSNAAFESFLRAESIQVEDFINHPDLMYQILLYHIVPKTFKINDFKSGQVLSTLLEDYPLTIDTMDERTQVVAILSQANIVTSNIKAGQAVVHIIDKILVPFNISLQDDVFTKQPSLPNKAIDDLGESTIVQKSSHSESVGLEDLSIFMELLDAAEIGEILQGDLNGMSIFVPTNEAFQTLFKALELSYEQIIEDKVALKDILLYHVVPQHITSKQLVEKLVLPTLLESKMLVIAHQYHNNITNIRGIGSTAKVSTHAINLGQGIIHVLDTVLLPFIPPEQVDIHNFPQFHGYQQRGIEGDQQGEEPYPGILDRMMASINSLLR